MWWKTIRKKAGCNKEGKTTNFFYHARGSWTVMPKRIEALRSLSDEDLVITYSNIGIFTEYGLMDRYLFDSDKNNPNERLFCLHFDTSIENLEVSISNPTESPRAIYAIELLSFENSLSNGTFLLQLTRDYLQIDLKPKAAFWRYLTPKGKPVNSFKGGNTNEYQPRGRASYHRQGINW